MTKRKLIPLLLASAMALSLAACGDKSDGKETKSEVESTASQPADSSAVSQPDESFGAVSSAEESKTAEDKYKLPKGAASEYEVYKTVIDFLNNGYHYDDLKDVYDPVIQLVYKSKKEEDPKDNFTLGLDFKESYALISDLIAKANELPMPVDDDGDFEDDRIDFDAFVSVFPENLRSKTKDNPVVYKGFLGEQVYSIVTKKYPKDGKNPFAWSEKTKWTAVEESKLKTEDLREKFHEYEDLLKAFPQFTCVNIGKESSNTYDIYTTKIDGRYYLVGFHTTSGGGLGG